MWQSLENPLFSSMTNLFSSTKFAGFSRTLRPTRARVDGICPRRERALRGSRGRPNGGRRNGRTGWNGTCGLASRTEASHQGHPLVRWRCGRSEVHSLPAVSDLHAPAHTGRLRGAGSRGDFRDGHLPVSRHGDGLGGGYSLLRGPGDRAGEDTVHVVVVAGFVICARLRVTPAASTGYLWARVPADGTGAVLTPRRRSNSVQP